MKYAAALGPALALILLIGCGRPGGTPDATQSSQRGATANRQFNDVSAAYLATEAAGQTAVRSETSQELGAGQGPGMAGDRFDSTIENEFVRAVDHPLSTFSIDVDTASYAKTRMYLRGGSLPPRGAVRIEEFVNYFDYEYSPPAGEDPFSIHVESSVAPWQPEHRLVRVALKGREIERERTRCNLVFLLDVSGSMDYPNKLPLLKQGMRMLASQLTENDRVAIVVYAGAAGLVLPSTPGDQHARIVGALDQLHAGGSTNGGQGIRLAYRVAQDHLVHGGVNRVILCSDGDFNVGTTSRAELVNLAEAEAQRGVYLSVLGFGIGNHNDAMMEELSNKANGNYAFIDTEQEAKKVLCEQINSTLVAIAKDVKIQIEFNPARVASYRLVGYENRVLQAEDFNNDQKDAGEIGAGHSVTALYELTLAQDPEQAPPIDPLRYQTSPQLSPRSATSELLTLKVRYKRPNEETSNLIEHHVPDQVTPFTAATRDFQFAAAVASFAMLLRESQYRGQSTFAAVEEIAAAARGEDQHGYRAEFLDLVKVARRLTKS